MLGLKATINGLPDVHFRLWFIPELITRNILACSNFDAAFNTYKKYIKSISRYQDADDHLFYLKLSLNEHLHKGYHVEFYQA